MFEDLQLSSENNLNNPDIQESQALVEQVHLFDDVVSHSYLQKLSECEVVEFSDMNFTTMRWYSITKIVMEKNAFFPDKTIHALYGTSLSCEEYCSHCK